MRITTQLNEIGISAAAAYQEGYLAVVVGAGTHSVKTFIETAEKEDSVFKGLQAGGEGLLYVQYNLEGDDHPLEEDVLQQYVYMAILELSKQIYNSLNSSLDEVGKAYGIEYEGWMRTARNNVIERQKEGASEEVNRVLDKVLSLGKLSNR